MEPRDVGSTRQKCTGLHRHLAKGVPRISKGKAKEVIVKGTHCRVKIARLAYIRAKGYLFTTLLLSAVIIHEKGTRRANVQTTHIQVQNYNNHVSCVC